LPKPAVLVLTLWTGPFVATIGTTLLVTGYMVVGPAHWLKKTMQLTYISWDFKLFIIALGVLYIALAWLGQNVVFQRLARLIGQAKESLTKLPKTRKQYKLIRERMLL
jgi:cation-transporting P-type ATPase 13A2